MLVDLLHLSRNLRRSPASAAAAVLTLSLTLGAGASIFAVVDAVLLTPPPFTNPEALVTIGETPIDGPAAAPRAVSYATFEAWRERAGSLAALEAYDPTNLTLTELGAAERVSATSVTPAFLTLLGVTPALIGGVLLAIWMTPAVGRLALDQFGGTANREAAVSWRVIGVVSLVASACAWICGLVPALSAARRSVVDVLRRGATPPPRELVLRRAFVAGEIALAFVLLVSVTLVGRSLLGVLKVNPGFVADGVLTMSVSLPAASYTNVERVVSLYSTLHTALEARLGPHTIAIVNEVPLTGDRGRSLVSVRPTDIGGEAVVREAGTAYFDVMRIPIVAGRPFDQRDNASAPARVVVSELLAERLFGFEPPIGRHIRLGATAQRAEIVGVAGDVKHRALDEAPSPTLYLSAWQSASRSRQVVVRSARPDADVIAAVREEVARLDRNLPVYATRSMRELVAASPGVPARRVLTAAFMGFALLAVVLGGIGLFGVVAHDVACRRQELGIRIALGADPRHILSATLGQGVAMVGFGLAAGGLLSIWAARAFGAVVLAAGHLDVLSVGMPAAVLLVVGAGAVLPAAWRAAHTNPLIALRSE